MTASILALIPLFALSAAFSGSETILFSLTVVQRSRIRSRSPRSDEAIGRCMDDSAMLLSTILVGNTFVNFAIATLCYSIASGVFPRAAALAAVPCATVLLLLFGEIAPKRLALRYAENLAPACARFLLFWRAVLKPINFAFRFSSRAFAGAIERERRALSDAELVSVLESAAERGEFAADDAEMIAGVLRLSELHAGDEMTPRVDMEGFDSDYPEDVRAAKLAAATHRFLPVYRRSPDAVEGIIEASTGKMQEALFVPEQVSLDDLLVTFRKSGRSMAVVTDEYGGTAGIITLNDIMELILGPSVFGSAQSAEPAISKKGANVWEIDARASLEEINRELELDLEAEDADRLSGWVAFHAGRIPHVGQEIVAQGCKATILKRRRRRVTLVRLEILSRPDAGSDADLIAETDEQVEKTEEENS